MSQLKTITWLLIALFTTSHWSVQTVNAQSCKNKFKDQLEASSKLLECGANFTVEELPNGKCIYKKYFLETKRVTNIITYKSKKDLKLEGLYEERWDDGQVFISGNYSNNVKEGIWIERGQVGHYQNGEKTGEWKTYTNDSILMESSFYLNGKLHGPLTRYDSLGAVSWSTTYENGNKTGNEEDPSLEFIEDMPRFPGCENSGFTGQALKKCSEDKMLQYIFQNVKYPKSARNNNIEGTAIVEFNVDKDGSTTDIQVLRGLCNDVKSGVYLLIKEMPTWKPGIKEGRPIKVKYTLPIKFRLE